MKIKLFLCVSALCMLFSNVHAEEVFFDRDSRTVIIEENINCDASVILLKPDMSLTEGLTKDDILQRIENLVEFKKDGESGLKVTLPVGDISGSCTVLVNGDSINKSYKVEVYSRAELDTALSELSEAAGKPDDKTRISAILSDTQKCKILMADDIYSNAAFKDILINVLAEKDSYSSYMEVNEQIARVQKQIDCLNEFNSMVNKVQVRDLIEKLYTVAFNKDEYYTRYMSLSLTGTVDQAIFSQRPYSSLDSVHSTLISAINNMSSGAAGGSGGGGGAGGSSGGSSGGAGGIVSLGPVNNAPVSDEAVHSKDKFKDVTANHWAYKYIYALEKRGIVSGTSDDAFKPETEITREAFITMLVLALNVDVTDEADSFTDTDKGAWYSRYISAAARCGLVSGYSDGSFGIGKTLSRQDMAVFIMRSAKLAGASLPVNSSVEYADADRISQYARESVAILSGAGMMNGMGDNCFVPAGVTTRCQAARMVYELIKVVEGTV